MKKNHTDFGRPGTVQILSNLRKKVSLLIKQYNQSENLFVLSSSKSSFVIIDMQNFSCAPAMGEALPRIGEVIAKSTDLLNSAAEW